MTEAHELAAEDEWQPSTPWERLTYDFYRWEIRGRGWQLWELPVELEPPFRPFYFHRNLAGGYTDDARHPTLIGGFLERTFDRWRGKDLRRSRAESLEEEIEEPIPQPDPGDSPIVEVTVALPPDYNVDKEVAEQFLLALSSLAAPVSYEVIGTATSIQVQFACREADAPQLRQQLQAYFPGAVLSDESLIWDWDRDEQRTAVIADFGLSDEFMRPLSGLRSFRVDPLIAVAGALSDLQPDEMGVLQILFQPARNPWSASIVRAVTDSRGGSFFSDAPEMVALAKQKIARPMFAATVRIGVQSPVPSRAWDIARGIGGALAQLALPSSNELIPLENDHYPDDVHAEDLLGRMSHRSGMLLNSDELVSLVHLPGASVRAEKLKRSSQKTRPAPSAAQGHALRIGENTHNGQVVEVTLNAEQRTRHTYVVGASGTGKSTLLLNMIIQDMEKGDGLAVFDPHGDLIDQILARVPENRFEDVVLVDPSDDQFPVGFNILSAHSELEKNLLSSDLVGIFRRLSTSWGDQMNAILANAILAFLESEKGGTLMDLRRFLVEPAFRAEHLKTVTDPEIVYYFEKEFTLLRGVPHAPILTRLDTFLRPKPVRYMVAQKDSKLDFASIMNGGKIFLAKLSHGAIGEENSHLLGALMVAKFHQLAMGRQEIAEAQRRNFWLYIDEFHEFLTPSVASLLTGARKYRLGLVLAHQELRQLWNQDSSLASAVTTNPCTRVCFRVGDFDAKKLEEGFSSFAAKDLQSLGIGEAIARVDRADQDFNLRTYPLSEAETAAASAKALQLIERSRQKYARPRAEVETILARPETKTPERTTQTTAAAPRASKPTTSPEPAPQEPETPKSTKPPAEPSEKTAPRDTHEPTPTEPAPRQPMPPAPKLGRGGREHKYLQNLIKRLAEDRGYKATIEQPVLDGTGSIDVALEKGERRIACEISVTTSADHEIGNIQKCLASGYETVLVVSSDPKTLRAVRAAVEKQLEPSTLDRIQFLPSEDFSGYLDELSADDAGHEETVRGYKVRTRFKSVSEAEAKARKQAISQVLLKRRKRLKDPK